MYRKREGFKKEVIQDVTCWVPPVGKVYDYMSGKIVDTGVYSRNLYPHEQYWEIPIDKEWYDLRRKAEKKRQRGDSNFVDGELQDFIRREWFRRINGFWFMSNGKPTYITGTHYFYLTYWNIDIGSPHYRDTDRRYFYFWRNCVEDPRCGGMLNFAPRREGKSWRAMCILYEALSRPPKRGHGGIQSKTNVDAKKLFLEKLVGPFTKLPDFFIPTYDRSQGTRPKTKLSFFPTSTRSRGDLKYEDSLENEIDYVESGERAYDGQKLSVYVRDEFGKTEIDLAEAHRVVKYCVVQDGKIGGKALYTTTVEDIGGKKSPFRTIKQCKKLFDESNPLERDENERTESMLYRFRTYAYEAEFFDKYGMPEINKAKKYFNATFSKLEAKGDYRALASERRKKPFSDADIFRLDSEDCRFNAIALTNRHAWLLSQKEEHLYETGNFVWKDGIRDSVVVWSPNPGGRFKVRHFLHEDGSSNLVRTSGGFKFPENWYNFVIGIDPYDHMSSEGKLSDGAAYGMKKYDPYEEELSYSLVFEYCARPLPNVFWEDMIKACHYYGCQMMFESQKMGIWHYFVSRGYQNFAIWIKGRANPGIPSSIESKVFGSDLAEIYFDEHIDKIFFPGLIEDALGFDIRDTTKFDRMMAFLWTLVGAKQGRGYVGPRDEGPTDIKKYIKMHKV